MRDQIFEIFHKWLRLEDEIGIDCILANAISALLPGDPLWMFVVAPPGGTKTEICQAFSGPHVYSIDFLTPQALLSGFRGKKGQKVDILEDLQGKLLVIKDFTTMLQKPQATRDEVFGRLRAAYDGSLSGAYGSGVRTQRRVSTFGILAAVTPAIDNYTTVHALLGERFIRIRNLNNRKESARKAIKQLGREQEMRQELREIIRIALDYYDLKASGNLPTVKPETISKIVNLADFMSVMRTGVPRNYKNEITSKPEPEEPTRLSKQLTRLAQALFVLDCYDYNHLLRVANDTVPKTRKDIVETIYKNEGIDTGELMGELKLPRHVAINVTDDLQALEIINKDYENNTYKHYLSPEFRKTMKEAGL